jgi:hypothetical protein
MRVQHEILALRYALWRSRQFRRSLSDVTVSQNTLRHGIRRGTSLAAIAAVLFEVE